MMKGKLRILSCCFFLQKKRITVHLYSSFDCFFYILFFVDWCL